MRLTLCVCVAFTSVLQQSRLQFDANDSSVEDAMVRQLASQTDVEATRVRQGAATGCSLGASPLAGD